MVNFLPEQVISGNLEWHWHVACKWRRCLQVTMITHGHIFPTTQVITIWNKRCLSLLPAGLQWHLTLVNLNYQLVRGRDWLLNKGVLEPRVSPACAIIVILNLAPYLLRWEKGHWPLDDCWPHGCWGHMCDSTQGSRCPSPMKIHQSMWISDPFAKTWTRGHWPLDDLWPHICWSHMCDSTQGSLCPSPMGIHQCMWIQWSILQITTYILRTKYYVLWYIRYILDTEWVIT